MLRLLTSTNGLTQGGHVQRRGVTGCRLAKMCGNASHQLQRLVTKLCRAIEQTPADSLKVINRETLLKTQTATVVRLAA